MSLLRQLLLHLNMPDWKQGIVFQKDPNSVLDYEFDWSALTNGSGSSDWLSLGETISSATVVVSAGLTKDSDTLVNSNTGVRVFLSGGSIGIEYTVACLIVTSDARTDERTITIYVANQ